MQILLKNLFNLMVIENILFVSALNIFLQLSVKGTSGYQKINFFTTSALS